MTKKNEWARHQLPPSKQESPMWTDFADALQQLFDEHVKPVFERVQDMGSYFTMNPEDLQRRINELGHFFYFTPGIDPEDFPLAVLQKLDEVHFKRTDAPIETAIAREFKGLEVRWQPLYAPKVINHGGTDYTQKLVAGQLTNALRTASDIEYASEDIADYFMTSRGVIEVNSSGLLRGGIDSDTFSDIVRRVIMPIIPVDIVYDGEKIVIHYDLLEPVESLRFGSQSVTQSHPVTVDPGCYVVDMGGDTTNAFTLSNSIQSEVDAIDRFDRLPIDSWPLDGNPIIVQPEPPIVA